MCESAASKVEICWKQRVFFCCLDCRIDAEVAAGGELLNSSSAYLKLLLFELCCYLRT